MHVGQGKKTGVVCLGSQLATVRRGVVTQPGHVGETWDENERPRLLGQASGTCWWGHWR